MYKLILALCFAILPDGRAQVPYSIAHECSVQFTKALRAQDQCHNQLILPSKFYAEFNTTLFEWSGNEEDLPVVNAAFDKYCRIMPHFLDCFNVVDDLTDDCKTHITNDVQRAKIITILRSVSSYACENDRAVLKKMLPYDGYSFFFRNDDMNRCYDIVRNIPHIDVHVFCAGLDRALPCFVEVIGDHPNKDLLVMTRELLNRYKLDVNC